MENYYNWDNFKNLYLEDSYVLSIKVENNALIFNMELVLCKQHNLYVKPQNDEYHCYRLGQLIFSELEHIKWDDMNQMQPSVDKTNQIDYGNIDYLYKSEGSYYLGGEWGNIVVKSHKIDVLYY